MDSEKNGVQVEKLPAVLGIARAAEVAGVSRKTLRRWIKAGKVQASRADGGSSPVRIPTVPFLRVLGIAAVEE